MRDWEKAYREGNTPWDKGEAAPPLRAFLRQNSVVGRVLVPGCGTGHDVRLLAAQGAEVTGLDISPSALEKARAIPAVGGESYAQANLLELPDVFVGAFDMVFEHTCLCALEPSQRDAYAAAVHRAIRPEGQLLAIFYLEVEDYDGSGPPHPIAPEQINTLFGGRFKTLDIWTPTAAYDSRVGREQMRLMQRLD